MRQFRYLIAGGWNTIFGYAVGVGFYLLFSNSFHIVVIAVMANVLAITMSFLTYKLFVFRTHGQWMHEYLRTYVVYGGMALISVFILWLLIDGLEMTIWVAQGVTMISTVILSYLGHKHFTFRE